MNHSDANTSILFFFDVDDTLLDNDRVAEDLRRYLANQVGGGSAARYWEIFEQLRTELGYADYLGALQRYRVERPRDPRLLAVSHFMINYPFANRLFPESLDAVEYARRLGRAVILTDGDVVFQPLKIDRSGLYEAFDGQVLICIHKELELDDVEARYPAAHYVMVDDKVRILAAIKKHWGARVTTVFPRQGHYAHDAALVASIRSRTSHWRGLESCRTIRWNRFWRRQQQSDCLLGFLLLLLRCAGADQVFQFLAQTWRGWHQAIPKSGKAGGIPAWPTWETSFASGSGCWSLRGETGRSP